MKRVLQELFTPVGILLLALVAGIFIVAMKNQTTIDELKDELGKPVPAVMPAEMHVTIATRGGQGVSVYCTASSDEDGMYVIQTVPTDAAPTVYHCDLVPPALLQ